MPNKELIEKLRQLGWSRDEARCGVRASFHCEYCSRYLLRSVEDHDSIQVDLIVPAARGGRRTIANLAFACKTCIAMRRGVVPYGETRAERLRSIRETLLFKRVSKRRELEEIVELALTLAEDSTD